MRFAGLALHDATSDAKTIWLFREQLTRVGAFASLFEQFDALHERGYLAMGGQIVDAAVVRARRPRLAKDEKAMLRDGGTPAGLSKARTRQIDRDGRWTIKRGKKTPPPDSTPRQAPGQIAVPTFGYKNLIGIDRTHGFIRRFAVTHTARHDGSQLAAVLDPANTEGEVRADTAYRSRAKLALLDKRGLTAQFQRAKPRGKPMPSPTLRPVMISTRVGSLGIGEVLYQSALIKTHEPNL
jgi:transposase, IS5 family